MNTYLQRMGLFKRVLNGVISFIFVVSSIVFPASAHAQTNPQTILNLPAVGTAVMMSPTFQPAVIKGMTIHPEHPLRFDFIVDTGDSDVEGVELQQEANKLIKYFLASLTVPEDEMWVNLSPYEGERVIPEGFGDTEMGRDLLAQDYLLKQLIASLVFPEDELGKKFWERIYEKAREVYGTTDIPINTFNKIWIVPEKAVVYEHDQTALVIESHLKVMLEEDYVSLTNNLGAKKLGLDKLKQDDVEIISGISSEIVREILIPEIEKEVNNGKTFANLRQIYNSMILATWYKVNLEESLLGQVYVDKNKTKGVDTQDKQINQKIYDQYVEAFKKGVHTYVQRSYEPKTKMIVSKTYFSGGFATSSPLGSLRDIMRKSRQTYETTKRNILNKGTEILSSIKTVPAIVRAKIAQTKSPIVNVAIDLFGYTPPMEEAINKATVVGSSPIASKIVSYDISRILARMGNMHDVVNEVRKLSKEERIQFVATMMYFQNKETKNSVILKGIEGLVSKFEMGERFDWEKQNNYVYRGLNLTEERDRHKIAAGVSRLQAIEKLKGKVSDEVSLKVGDAVRDLALMTPESEGFQDRLNAINYDGSIPIFVKQSQQGIEIQELNLSHMKAGVEKFLKTGMREQIANVGKIAKVLKIKVENAEDLGNLPVKLQRTVDAINSNFMLSKSLVDPSVEKEFSIQKKEENLIKTTLIHYFGNRFMASYYVPQISSSKTKKERLNYIEKTVNGVKTIQKILGNLGNMESLPMTAEYIDVDVLAASSPTQSETARRRRNVLPSVFNKGGIDFNPRLLDLQIKRDGEGVPLPMGQQSIGDMNIEGFLPIILEVTPIPDLFLHLGVLD